MLSLLLSLALGSPADLGHPKFHYREAASQRIAEAMPWSLPIAVRGLQSGDIEIRTRSRRLIELGCPRLLQATGFLNPKVRQLFLTETYPSDALLASFLDPLNFADLLKAADLVGVVNPNQDLNSFQFFVMFGPIEGTSRILAARVRAVRLGLDPKLGWSASPAVPWKVE